MTARILGHECWRAAQARRARRNRAAMGMPLRPKQQPKRRSLDEVEPPSFDPSGGAA